jgi:hypothetical protein
MRVRFLFVYIFCLISWFVSAQNKDLVSQLLTGYEINYFGKNVFVHGRFVKKNHVMEAGINYNFSDGFSDNPVLGVGVYYGYQISTSKKWSTALGIDYRRQKPLKIVNIQNWCYSTSVEYSHNKNWSLLSRIGYGVAIERSASAGSFDQFNNLTGSLSISCVYHL